MDQSGESANAEATEAQWAQPNTNPTQLSHLFMKACTFTMAARRSSRVPVLRAREHLPAAGQPGDERERSVTGLLGLQRDGGLQQLERSGQAFFHSSIKPANC